MTKFPKYLGLLDPKVTLPAYQQHRISNEARAGSWPMYRPDSSNLVMKYLEKLITAKFWPQNKN